MWNKLAVIMKNIVTACTRDCPGGCSIIARIKKDGDGEKILKLSGNPDHDITDGFLCPNTSRYLKDVFYSPKRVLHPLKKEDGNWKRISWDEALNIAASKLSETIKRYGSSAILYYQGFGSRTALKILNRRFFNLLGGVSTLQGTICGGIGQAGQDMDFGTRISHDHLDHLNSKVIIVWGRNPAVTDVHLWKILRKAQRKGAKIVVVDPVKTKTARHADLFIQPKPGSDAYLAMAISKLVLMHDLVDWDFIENKTQNFDKYLKILEKNDLESLSCKCDVPVEKIEKLTLLYASNMSSSIVTGWGVHRYKNGHITFRMMDALAALTGNLGISGGGVSQGFEEFGFFDDSHALDDPKTGRKFLMPTIGEAILKAHDPPVKLIFVTSGNPVNLNPNSLKVKKAFETTDYVIMVDHFLNDTSDVADLFLPATTFLEEEDLVGSYGHNWVSPINPASPPRGEAKSELEIFQLLADRLGIKDGMDGTPKEWLQKLALPILKQGISFEDLKEGPMKLVPAYEIPYADGKFGTASGYFEFIQNFDENEYNPLKEHIHCDDFKKNHLDAFRTQCFDDDDDDDILRLIAVGPERWINSVVPESEMIEGFLEIKVSGELLAHKGMFDGETAVLRSKAGKLKVKVKESEDVRPDFVLTYRGGWMKYGKNVNVLTDDSVSTAGNGTPYHETWVKLEKLEKVDGSDFK
jgi:anaerobic selenocysteine-containing dehydrogenase